VAAHDKAPQTTHAALPQISGENSVAASAAAATTVPAVNKISPTPAASKLPVPAAAVKPVFSASAGSHATTGGGAASAPAPAREADSHSAEISTDSPAIVADVASDKPVEASHNDPAFVGAAPAFTFGGANLPEEKSGKSKKTFLGIAAVVLVGAALYYGWTQYKGATTSPVQTAAPTRPVPAPPIASTTSAAAPTGSAVPVSQPGVTTTSPNGASSASQPSAVPTAPVSTAPGATKPAGSVSPEPGKSSPDHDSTNHDSTKPDPTKPDATNLSSAKTASKPGSAKPAAAAPLVVKGGTAPALQAADATPDSPAPSMTGIAASGASAPPPDLGSGAGGGPKPVLQTVNISQGVSQGLVIRKVSPIYPKTALTMRTEGPVELMATISRSGDITHVKVLSGDAQLTNAAVAAVKQWKYKPYLLNGEPVEIQTQITINFKLPD
jgi:protein TonB